MDHCAKQVSTCHKNVKMNRKKLALLSGKVLSSPFGPLNYVPGTIKWKRRSHSKNKGHPIAKIIADDELAYGRVHHGYIKNKYTGMTFEVLVEIATLATINVYKNL